MFVLPKNRFSALLILFLGFIAVYCLSIWSKFHEEALISGYAKRGAWLDKASLAPQF